MFEEISMERAHTVANPDHSRLLSNSQTVQTVTHWQDSYKLTTQFNVLIRGQKVPGRLKLSQEGVRWCQEGVRWCVLSIVYCLIFTVKKAIPTKRTFNFSLLTLFLQIN